MTSVVFRRCALPPGCTGAWGPRAFSTDLNRPRSRPPPPCWTAAVLPGTGASLRVSCFLFLLALTYARRLDNISLRGVSPCGAASRPEPHDSAVVACATTARSAGMRGDDAVFRRITGWLQARVRWPRGDAASSRSLPVAAEAAPTRSGVVRDQCKAACSRLAVLPVISLSV